MTESSRRALVDFSLIAWRSIATLSNVVIFIVLGLLFYLGEKQTALFLSLAVVGGVLIGLVNDIRARLALEKLHLLTTPMYTRVRVDTTQERVYTQSLKQGDRIRLKLGDQVPCDATLLSAQNVEVSQALRTGESDTFAKKEGERVFAGDIIMSGTCVARIDTSFAESHLYQMTNTIKRYAISRSPIQQSIQTIIVYSGYLLLGLIGFVLLRGSYLHKPLVDTIKVAAALTGTLVPQGLIVAVTILFAYGAIRMYKEHVLMQDVNATEKLGSIKNLCIDKTGTLTETTPTVKHIHIFGNMSEKEALALTKTYLVGSGDSSQTAHAIVTFISFAGVGLVRASLPFTSQRQFGAVEVLYEEKTFSLVMAGPDVLAAHVHEGQEWLRDIASQAEKGTRLVCVAKTLTRVPPQTLVGVSLQPFIVFELESRLRDGTRNIIEFFQKRGVRVRVISGDKAETVQVIARAAGIDRPDKAIEGSEIEKWSDEELAEKIDTYTVFARIRPELKEKLIKQFQKTGFTAMVGDGANDALAIKQADLGIAMFEGAQATRQLSSVVLMNNSFSALPEGVRMADTIIGNAYIISCLYFFEMGVGLILYALSTLLGIEYPLSPQNILLLNYCGVALPGFVTFFWTMRDIGTIKRSSKSYLVRVGIYSCVSSAFSGVLLMGLVLYNSSLSLQALHTTVLLGFLLTNCIFFFATPFVFTTDNRRVQVRSLLGCMGVIGLVLVGTFASSSLRLFFDIEPLSISTFLSVGVVSILFALVHYIVVRHWAQN